MSDLGWRRLPVVVAAIEVADRGVCQLRRVEVVQTGQVDAAEIATQDIEITVAKRLYAAVLAEQMVPGFGTKLVVRQLALAGQKAKSVGLDDRAPPSGLSTERAVAFGGALTQIDIRLIVDCSTVATSYERFLHLWTSSVAQRLFTTRIQPYAPYSHRHSGRLSHIRSDVVSDD